ncbi:MAG: polysaccharide biosynthesis tyrosine autokinase [Zetaproteobacteria bacterium]|nr:MAG: polysaccharide biosynthesis tyrosine autokinase [Zetaproteobacteria bacterium]
MASIAEGRAYDLNLDEYWQIIVRRRWVILFCAASLGLFSWIFAWLHQPPPLYSSMAAVKVDTTVDVDATLSGGGTRRKRIDMDTQLSLIRSYALMERAARALGYIPDDVSSDEARLHPVYINRIIELKNAIEVEQEGNGGLITITAVSPDARDAQRMAQAVAEEYIRFNREEQNRQVYEAKKFVRNQMEVVGKRLKEAEDAVRRFSREHGMTLAGSDPRTMTRILNDLENQYRATVQHLADLRFTLKQLKRQFERTDEGFTAITVVGKVSNYFSALNQRLIQMQLKHTELATAYTSEHPQMRELQAQADDILVDMVDELINQVRLTQTRERELKRRIALANARFASIPSDTAELARLNRTVSINEDLFNQLEQKYQELLIRESQQQQTVTLVRPAMLSYDRINPVKLGQTAAAGFLLGLVLGLVIALILEAMDTSIGTIEEVESFLELPVIGYIPQLEQEEAEEIFSRQKGLAVRGGALDRQIRLITHFAPAAVMSEAYRSLRTNLLFSQGGSKSRVLMLTSSTMKEGKSSTAANLAIVLVQQGARVLLVDGDMRKPMVHHTFGVEKGPGLSDCLLGQYPWRDAVKRFSDIVLGEMGIDMAMYTPGLDQLELLTCGNVRANPPDLLASETMTTMLEEFRKEYDFVIIDMPPSLHTTDATILAGRVDGVLLVYHVGSVVRGALKRVKTTLEGVGANIVGLVLNGVRGEISADFKALKMDQYYAYGYGAEDEYVRKPLVERARAWLEDAWLYVRGAASERWRTWRKRR